MIIYADIYVIIIMIFCPAYPWQVPQHVCWALQGFGELRFAFLDLSWRFQLE